MLSCSGCSSSGEEVLSAWLLLLLLVLLKRAGLRGIGGFFEDSG